MRGDVPAWPDDEELCGLYEVLAWDDASGTWRTARQHHGGWDWLEEYSDTWSEASFSKWTALPGEDDPHQAFALEMVRETSLWLSGEGREREAKTLMAAYRKLGGVGGANHGTAH